MLKNALSCNVEKLNPDLDQSFNHNHFFLGTRLEKLNANYSFKIYGSTVCREEKIQKY